MRCPYEAAMQAYLDGELSRETRKEYARHLESCNDCRTALAELKRLSAWTEEALEAALPPLAPAARIDVDAAWARFESGLQKAGLKAREAQPTMKKQDNNTMQTNVQPLTKRSWFSMAKTYQKWLAGTAAAAVVLGTLTIPQVQAAATDLLSLFRVEKVELIKMTEQDFQDISSWFQSNAPGEMELKGIGKIWVEDGADRNTYFFASKAEAESSGVTAPPIPEGYVFESINAQNSFSINMELDVNKANSMLRRLGSEAQFDEQLNNKRFTVTWPQKQSMGMQGANKTWLRYSVNDAPKIEVPSGVDLDQLRKTMLSLPFIPADVSKQLASIEDWQTTLPLPLIEDRNDMQEVKVNGVKGLLAVNPNHPEGMLIWQKDGKLHMLEMNATIESKIDLKAELLKVAKTYDN